MKKTLLIAMLYTMTTTLVLGLGYPLVVTGLAHILTPDKAEGQLIVRDGTVIGSVIIAQPFSGDSYFHPRPSAAGANGYDATASGGSNYGPTNRKLLERVSADVEKARSANSSASVPIDMVTTSASGLDPDITPANAAFQAPRVARARNQPLDQVLALIHIHTQLRQLGLFGEPRVNVLQLNLALDQAFSTRNASNKVAGGRN